MDYPVETVTFHEYLQRCTREELPIEECSKCYKSTRFVYGGLCVDCAKTLHPSAFVGEPTLKIPISATPKLQFEVTLFEYIRELVDACERWLDRHYHCLSMGNSYRELDDLFDSSVNDHLAANIASTIPYEPAPLPDDWLDKCIKEWETIPLATNDSDFLCFSKAEDLLNHVAKCLTLIDPDADKLEIDDEIIRHFMYQDSATTEEMWDLWKAYNGQDGTEVIFVISRINHLFHNGGSLLHDYSTNLFDDDLIDMVSQNGLEAVFGEGSVESFIHYFETKANKEWWAESQYGKVRPQYNHDLGEWWVGTAYVNLLMPLDEVHPYCPLIGV